MVLMLIVILSLSLVLDINMLKLLAPLSEVFHHYCLNLLPNNMAYRELSSALVCGQSLYNSPNLKPVKALGVIHLFVVSGFHIQLIYSWLNPAKGIRSKSNQIFILSLLFAYTLACQLKPPILRAFSQIALPINKSNPSSLKILITGLFLLTLAPELWLSLSLQLSWVAVLIFSQKESTYGWKLVLVYFCSLLLLSPMALAHPLSILIGVVLTPLFATVILPLHFLALIIPQLYSLIDNFWSLLIVVAENWLSLAPLIEPSFQLHRREKWALLIFFNLYLYAKDIYRRRKLLCHT